MTTFWLTFNDLDAPANERFLGVAIFDMDEGERQLSGMEIARRAWDLGINPGGTVLIQEVKDIPQQYKNKLLKDDALLIGLGSKGRNTSLLPNTAKCSCCGEPTQPPSLRKRILKPPKKKRKIGRSAA